MPLIQRLEIEGFRCFRKLAVGGLTRVNLIVGENNSGKTALLEAVEVFATNGAENRLWWTANRRGEIVNHNAGSPGTAPEYTYDLRSVFFGRPKSLSQRSSFSIASGTEKVTVTTQPAGREIELLTRDRRGDMRPFPISSDLGVARVEVPALGRRVRDVSNVLFVPAGDVMPAVVRELWSEVVGNPSEKHVHEVLSLVDDRVEQLVIAPVPMDAPGWEGVYLRLKGENERIAISEFGDGMKKATQLALALVRARGGTLLIDEIDDGLHFSVLPRLWRFLLEAAGTLDVQVFATTHSKDCMEAIAAVHREDAPLASEISIHRLDRDEPKSADSDARAAATLIAADVELR
jgi:hypothetical protein